MEATTTNTAEDAAASDPFAGLPATRRVPQPLEHPKLRLDYPDLKAMGMTMAHTEEVRVLKKTIANKKA